MSEGVSGHSQSRQNCAESVLTPSLISPGPGERVNGALNARRRAGRLAANGRIVGEGLAERAERCVGGVVGFFRAATAGLLSKICPESVLTPSLI
jgi:hypothetical protein